MPRASLLKLRELRLSVCHQPFFNPAQLMSRRSGSMTRALIQAMGRLPASFLRGLLSSGISVRNRGCLGRGLPLPRLPRQNR